jgi:hypothetical protein
MLNRPVVPANSAALSSVVSPGTGIPMLSRLTATPTNHAPYVATRCANSLEIGSTRKAECKGSSFVGDAPWSLPLPPPAPHLRSSSQRCRRLLSSISIAVRGRQ